MCRVALVRLLLAHVAGSDLGCISDPDLMPQILDQFDEPLAVARGLHADQHRRRQLLIEHPGVAASMHQLPFPAIPSLHVHPTHLLPAGMEITSYNHHRRLLSSQRLRPQTKTTWVRIEPSLLSNQSKLRLGGSFELFFITNNQCPPSNFSQPLRAKILLMSAIPRCARLQKRRERSFGPLS